MCGVCLVEAFWIRALQIEKKKKKNEKQTNKSLNQAYDLSAITNISYIAYLTVMTTGSLRLK